MANPYEVTRTDHLAVHGLNTEKNPYTASPDGSLSAADNVVIERPGEVEPRPGFALSEDSDDSVLPVRLFPWQGDVLRINADSTSWVSDPTDFLEVDTGIPIPWTEFRARTSEMRRNLYVNTADGVRKIYQAGYPYAVRSGISPLPVADNFGNTGTTGFLANSNYVAYRVLIARTDLNGLVIRSASVGAVAVKNGTGATRTTQIITYLRQGNNFDGDGMLEGDVLELYRTRQSAAIPGNEFFLAQSFALTSTQLTAGYCVLTDNCLDADLGAALYTNDSREGLEGANYRAPMGRELATFRNSLFVADTLSPKRFIIKYSEGGTRTGFTTGIGHRTYTGTRTHNSATITLAAPLGSTSELLPGMMLNDATGGTNWDDTPLIDSVTNTTHVLMTEIWRGATDGAPIALEFADTVVIGGSYYPIDTAGHFMQCVNSGDVNWGVDPNVTYYAYATGAYSYSLLGTGQQNLNNISIVIEEVDRGDTTTNLIEATHGSEYFPILPAPDAGTTLEPEADDLPNNIAWSKKDEPEHFPLSFNELVGKENENVLRLMPTRDALWVFKTDGLWRLSGVEAPFWRIDPFDPTLRLLIPDACVVLDDIVYAWTNRGVVAVSDAGVIPLSGPIQTLLDYQQRLFVDPDNWTYSVWMCADPTRSNILLGLQQIGGDVTDRTSTIYVFNTRTVEWTTWQPPTGGLQHMAHDSNRLVNANSYTGAIELQRTTLDTASLPNEMVPVYADYDYALTITAVSSDGLTITIAGASGWSPTDGEAVTQSGSVYLVTGNNSTTEFTVHQAGLTAASAVAWTAITSTLVWNPKGLPTVTRRWRELLLSFEQSSGLYEVDATFETPASGATVTKKLPTYTEVSGADYPSSVRVLAPRNVTRSTIMNPGITITQALSPWRISGIGMVSDEVSTRVSR